LERPNTMTNRREFLSRGAMAVGAVAFPGLAAGQSATEGRTGSAVITKPASGKSPLTKLNNGVEMPVLGVGSYALPTIQAADVISFALCNGYRLVDTASNYGNEKEVGEGISRSGVERSKVFVSTKLWIENYGYDEALRAFDQSLQKLGLDSLTSTYCIGRCRWISRKPSRLTKLWRSSTAPNAFARSAYPTSTRTI
jgi:hypothetical protein